MAQPASAAGVGDVEVSPDRGPGDTSTVGTTAFHLRVPRQASVMSGFELRNTAVEVRTVRLYAAGATRKPDGAFTVGGPGEAPWVELPDQSVTLQAGERRRVMFSVRDPGVPAGETGHAAIVIEVPQGAVTLRAATIIYAEVPKPGRGLVPFVLAAVGVVAVLGAVAAQVIRWRRRGS